jgi:hypothetical protein
MAKLVGLVRILEIRVSYELDAVVRGSPIFGQFSQKRERIKEKFEKPPA